MKKEGPKRAPRTRVLIVDDHMAFSEALGIAIDIQPDIVFVGSARSVEEALEKVAEASPDVVLLDLRLPGVDGIEGLKQIKALRPATRVLILTAFAEAEAMAQAATAVAGGFFPKERPVGEILQAIRTVSDGGMMVEATTLAAVLRNVHEPSAPTEVHPPPGMQLTERQREVLALLAEGLDPRAIARMLGISVNTSRGHVKSVIAKLGVHSQLEAVVAAVRMGLLDMTPTAGASTE